MWCVSGGAHSPLASPPVSFTFQDLVDSDVSHKLLHSVILQVAVAAVHL